MLDDVREVFCAGFDENGMRYDEAGYKAKVVDRAPKSRFRASLLWLVDMGAITPAQALLILSKCIQAYVAGLPGADEQQESEGPDS